MASFSDAFTVCVSVADVLGANVLSPRYLAVIEWAPTARAAVVNVTLLVLSSGPEPSGLVASLKVTTPLGVVLEGLVDVTVAVKVTLWPPTDGLTEDAIATDIALLTT